MRLHVLALTLALGGGLLCPTAALAQGKKAVVQKESEKVAAIRKLMLLTGSGQLGLQVMTQMIGSLRGTLPKVPPKFWDDFMKEVSPDELIDLIVPIYEKYLSLSEVKDVIRFYETPAGKKLISILPQVTQESMEVGKQWGAQLGARVAKKLKEQGYDK